jgi:hypothetical protein
MVGGRTKDLAALEHVLGAGKLGDKDLAGLNGGRGLVAGVCKRGCSGVEIEGLKVAVYGVADDEAALEAGVAVYRAGGGDKLGAFGG